MSEAPENGYVVDTLAGAEPRDIAIVAAIAVAEARTRSPNLSVVLIRDGSLLDRESRVALDAEMRRLGVQALVEFVDDDGDGFVIEDGTLEAAIIT